MDFDNAVQKIDLPSDIGYTSLAQIWNEIQTIKKRLRFQKLDTAGIVNPPTNEIDLLYRLSDSKVVLLRPDGVFTEIENPASGFTDAGTKVKENGTLISSVARPLNVSTSVFDFTEDAFNDHHSLAIATNAITDAMVSTHSSTKISIANVSQLPASVITETNTKTMTNKTLTDAIISGLLKTTNLSIKEVDTNTLGIRNVGDTLYKNLIANLAQLEDKLTLKNITAPTNSASGYTHLFVDTSDGHVKRIGSTGSAVDLETAGGGGAISILAKTTTNVNLTNSVTETSMFSASVPANTLSAHGVIRVTCRLEYTNNSAGNSSIVPVIKYGATTLFSDSIGTMTPSASKRVVHLNFEIYPDNNSASAQMMEGWIGVSEPGGATTGFGDPNDDEIFSSSPIAGNSSETTSTAKTLDVRFSLSDAATTITLTLKMGMMEVIA